MTITELERLLDTHKLEAEMRNGRWWAIRRNGATRRWKRDPNRFEIPIKAGLSSYGTINSTDLAAQHIRVRKD